MRYTDENVEALTDAAVRTVESFDFSGKTVEQLQQYLVDSVTHAMERHDRSLRQHWRSPDLTCRERRMSVRRQKISLLRRLRKRYDRETIRADGISMRVAVDRIVNRRWRFEYVIDAWIRPPRAVTMITIPITQTELPQ